MVGALPTRSACKFQEPNGVDTIVMKHPGMQTIRSGPAAKKRSRRSAQVTRAGGWMCEKIYHLRSREKNASLDVPFYRTFPQRRLLRRSNLTASKSPAKRTVLQILVQNCKY